MERREKGRKKKNEVKIKGGGERWGGKGRAGAAKGEGRE